MSLSGSLTVRIAYLILQLCLVKMQTTNIIMANWSREMWQRVVNRAVRMLASGPFAMHFASAFTTIS
ncbi:hypothetical protein KIN20_027167 [Parelaphostrongylus tenuis]|uniref:Secreted protein n=1 Tax=Parelaphostrongylus tenuis TaxID=148309 RepID=A0AAD5QYY1_PARTN|nr:hypothetical protein KIN20_027167 [Parelaphostrongylus tenuis]